MGGIHLYLVFNGVGGVLAVLFKLNAVGALWGSPWSSFDGGSCSRQVC
jgi:hypothetical protein